MARNGKSHDVERRHADERFIIAMLVETSRSAVLRGKQGTLSGLSQVGKELLKICEIACWTRGKWSVTFCDPRGDGAKVGDEA